MQLFERIQASAIASAKVDGQALKPEQETSRRPETLSLVSLRNYALAGACAALLLAVVELADIHVKLSPVFASLSERLIITAYFSLNLLSGALIGALVWLVVILSSVAKTVIERILPRRGITGKLRGVGAGFAVACLWAILLNQQPSIHRYVIGVIREAEKIPLLTQPLLNHERASSYMILLGLFIACSVAWMLARASGSFKPWLRLVWLMTLAAVILATYYVNSTVEAQLYEATLDASLFLLANCLALTLIGSLYESYIRGRFHWPRSKTLLAAIAIAFVGCLVITLFHFGNNQNLKTQLFFRTTQAKQHFKLAQWAFDFDRDGYSAFLDGGDKDERRSDINPSQPEIAGDGADNNSIGGDLTEQQVADWWEEQKSASSPPVSSPPVSSPPAGRAFNVVFIFIDALRPDHLGAYGYQRNTSPNIDRLASRSTVFENAYAPSPNTFESLPKFMQSSYWDGHFKTWTEVLEENGYNNLLFPRRITTLRRYVKGMKEAYKGRARTFDYTIDRAINILSETATDRPFCAFLYSTDPHRPYVKHEKFDFGNSLADLYDGEIAFTDFHLGRLFDWMSQSGRLDDTVIVIMADHGESLGERGMYKHSAVLYNDQIRIPMIIHVPGVGPRRVSTHVSSVDLGSTILGAVGLNPPAEYAGVNLMPLIRGEQLTRPPVYGEQTRGQESPYVPRYRGVHPESKKYMVITQDGYKLIYNRNYTTFELFDLNRDPQEQHNLYDREPEKAERLKQMIGRFVDVVTASRPIDADEYKYPFHEVK
ncbi:MAG TPA: sulfatase-like hydrolase/transferase [Blastocatellia bacterium]|nr:sulfatase-like hydrolase/transferase [Blastocatellia bacterium]